jgi:hypothetical protein
MRRLLVVLTGVAAAFTASSSLSAWGAHGHQLAGQAAVLALPDDVPAFFRNAAEQLSWLNPEPDRWRDRAERDADPALAEAFDPDHYIDMEIVPTGALDAPHRYAYLAVVTSAGKTAAEVGTSPYRMLEVFQRLRSSFRAWRAATDPKVRGWIGDRIINDAGILGHYVTDAANPLHTTIHHHGWVGPNPKAYPTDQAIHSRFESRFVSAHVTLDDLRRATTPAPRRIDAPRAAIMDFVRTSHGQLERLYELDKREAFGADITSAEHKQFVVERLAFGTLMLRDLWWTAWVTSAEA